MADDDIFYVGTVIFFSAVKGYGFLQWEKEGVKQKDLFLHYSDIAMEGFKTLYKDQRVKFKVGLNVRGEPKAICVEVLKN